MPTPLEYIEDGLIYQDWQMVNFGFRMLTGKDVLNGKVKKGEEDWNKEAYNRYSPTNEEEYDEDIDEQNRLEFEAWEAEQAVIESEEEEDEEEFAHYFVCSNCHYEFGHDKMRKACPDCKKHKLIEIAHDDNVKEILKDSSPKKNSAKTTVKKFKEAKTGIAPKKSGVKKKRQKGSPERRGRFKVDRYNGPAKFKGNNFVDTGELHIEDKEIDKALAVTNPVDRREAYEDEEVECDICGRDMSINPALVSEFSSPICNRCTRARSKG